MRATKGNKEYTIDEAQKKHYQDAGFDILNDDGEVIAYGRGKTVPYEDYISLQEENKQLKAKLKTAEKKAAPQKAGE